MQTPREIATDAMTGLAPGMPVDPEVVKELIETVVEADRERAARTQFEAAKAKALKFFAEEPWWLDNMVRGILDAAAQPAETVVNHTLVCHRPEKTQALWAMLERMYDGQIPTVKADRTLWHYVNVVQEWTIMQTWPGRFSKTLFNGTREQAEAFARKLRAENGGDVTIAEEW